MSLTSHPTIAALRKWASAQLIAVSDAANLDAEILLAHTLSVSRSYLFAWPDRLLTDAEQQHFAELLDRRLHNEPIAYITGHREFWSLDLVVTPDTLIPRPETELLVEHVLATLDDHAQTIADLGTGSGAIALALAHERPQWTVYATDCMPAALKIAALNAERFHLSNVIFQEGFWCDALPKLRFDAIISNPPYIALGDDALEAEVLQSEPRSALFSGENGLRDSREIIESAKSYLKSGGYIFLEHGYQQAHAVRELLRQAGYDEIVSNQDLAGLDRITVGRNKDASIGID